MKNDDEINSELAGKVIFWVLIFPLILVVGIKSCNTNLDEYNNKKQRCKFQSVHLSSEMAWICYYDYTGRALISEIIAYFTLYVM